MSREKVKLHSKRVEKIISDTKVTEIAKITGASWAKLSDEEKKPYHEKAEKDRKRWDIKRLIN